MTIEHVRKIAVLRANALGDYIFTLPALDALRAAYPNAEITLLGLDWHAGFLENRPGPVNRVIVIPPCRGIRDKAGEAEDPAELDRFFEAMTRERFDLALQLHGGGRYTNPFVRKLNAGLSVGLKTADAAPLDCWLPYVYYQHEVLRYLEVVSLVGAHPIRLEPLLSVTESDLADAEHAVPATHKPLVALHPGAGDPRRRWPPDKLAAVGDALARLGAHVVVTGIQGSETSSRRSSLP